jgi:hypothetical protein
VPRVQPDDARRPQRTPSAAAFSGQGRQAGEAIGFPMSGALSNQKMSGTTNMPWFGQGFEARARARVSTRAWREQVHDMIGVWQVPTPFAMNFMTKTDA